jgi:hypothetical protein
MSDSIRGVIIAWRPTKPLIAAKVGPRRARVNDGPRLCAPHQAQRTGGKACAEISPARCYVPNRCGWSGGHSRAPIAVLLVGRR